MNHKESAEQIALFHWASLMSGRYPELEYLHHIPNGGRRDAREAARLKREGVKAGVSDLHLPIRSGPYIGLWIELKAPDGAKPTKAQRNWIEAMNRQGHYATCCYGFAEARGVLEWYLGGCRSMPPGGAGDENIAHYVTL